MIKFVNNYQI